MAGKQLFVDVDVGASDVRSMISSELALL